MSTISNDFTIYQPTADLFELDVRDSLYLRLAKGQRHISGRIVMDCWHESGNGSDVLAEAAAMDRLSEVAAKAAAELRRRAAERDLDVPTPAGGEA